MAYTKQKLSELLEKAGAAELTDKLVSSLAELITLAKVKTLFGLDNLLTQYMVFPVEWGQDGATAPDAADNYTNTNGRDRIRKFSNSGSPSIVIPWIVSQKINAGAPALKYRVHCIVSEATGMNNEAIQFKMSGFSVGHGDASTAAYGATQTSAKTAQTQTQHKIVVTDWSDAVAVTDLAAGEKAYLMLERDNGVASNYAQKVAVVAVEIEYAVMGA